MNNILLSIALGVSASCNLIATYYLVKVLKGHTEDIYGLNILYRDLSKMIIDLRIENSTRIQGVAEDTKVGE